MEKGGAQRGGRARGRARPAAEQQQAAPGQARVAGAWGSGNPMRAAGGVPGQSQGFGGAPAPAPVPQQPVAWGPGQQQPPRQAAPPPAGAGRAQVFQGAGGDHAGPQRSAPASEGIVAEVGAGNGKESHSARGAMRGRRPIPETTLSTRMETLGKKGTAGENIVLQTNYFRLVKRADWCVYQYRVDFAPEIDVTFTKKKLFYTAVASMDLVKGLFDGTILFTPFRMSPDPKEIVVDSLTNPDEKVRITIRMVGELNRSSYHYIQLYNLIMRKCMSHLKLQQIKRDYFDPAAKVVISNYNLELWPGFLTSIRQHESDLLLCSEVKHKVMKTETALNVMMRITNDRRDGRDWKNKFHQRMLNTIVLTDYNNKTYHIDDVDFDKTPASSFTMKDNSSVTFADYYRKRYGLTITHMNQPLLVTKIKPAGLRGEGGGDGPPQECTMLLIPEFCRMTGLTEEERTNRHMKTALESYLQPGPESRINHLRNFNQRLHSTAGSILEMKRFDMDLSKDIVTLSGRKLPPEELIFQAPKSSYSAGRDADWTREMRSKPMFRNGVLNSWALVYSPKDKAVTQSFYEHLKKASSGMRWNWPAPTITALKTSPEKPYDKAAYVRTFEELFVQKPDLTFVFVVVPPSKTAETYSFIKKKLTVDRGIASQCVAASTCGHKSAFSIATKVAVQMVCKTGGAPWTIKNPLQGLMVVGYDACHDPTNKSLTFGAFVASFDPDLTAYYSEVFAHRDGEELCNNISAAMVRAVNFFANSKLNNGKLPAYILFYRDGVGEGQINFVYDHELKRIIDALTPMYQERNQQLRHRMIIVNKRTNTRLFHNGRNPPAGTVVDDIITLPERSDFFLVSQCTTKGTASPTYYSILGPDQFGLDSNKTQLITHRLCHQYYNWSGTVRVPAPCQYAHKLAFLAAQSLQRPPKESLSHLLHFL